MKKRWRNFCKGLSKKERTWSKQLEQSGHHLPAVFEVFYFNIIYREKRFRQALTIILDIFAPLETTQPSELSISKNNSSPVFSSFNRGSPTGIVLLFRFLEQDFFYRDLLLPLIFSFSDYR